MLNDFIVLVNRSCAVKTSQNDFFFTSQEIVVNLFILVKILGFHNCQHEIC